MYAWKGRKEALEDDVAVKENERGIVVRLASDLNAVPLNMWWMVDQRKGGEIGL